MPTVHRVVIGPNKNKKSAVILRDSPARPGTAAMAAEALAGAAANAAPAIPTAPAARIARLLGADARGQERLA